LFQNLKLSTSSEVISRNTKKHPIVDKFKMGEPYCDDPRCQRNRNGERHKIHFTNENGASLLGKIIVMIQDAREIGMEKDMNHTSKM
jgi:hypothetical protein